jgi:hypothetical protein
MTKNCKKVYSSKNLIFKIKNYNIIISRPQREYPGLQNKIFPHFFFTFCPPGSESGSSRPKTMQIRIHSTGFQFTVQLFVTAIRRQAMF